MNKSELIQAVAAKSDQIDADNLIGGITMDVTIKSVQRGPSNEQPVQLVLNETDKFYRPSKTFRRALIGCFGDDPANWVGQRIRLVRNPDTTFGGVKVGGIEVSHASIPAPIVLMLSTKRGKKTAVSIDVIPPVAQPVPMPDHVKAKGAVLRGESPVAKVPAPAPAIEGTATTITGDPSEGDLSVINPPQKPTQEELQKVIDAFDSIGYNREQLEKEYNKKLDDWTTEDLVEARQVYREKAAERKTMLEKIAAERAAAKAGNPPVEVS